jgi:ABC-type multidrug transport system ATPase subunit
MKMQVKVENLKKVIGDKKLLEIESIELESGKIYGIVGPNGAGKSTFLRILSGLDKEYDGLVLYKKASSNYRRFEDVKESIAMLHQKPYIFDMSVRENVELGLKLKGKKNRELVNDIINFLRLFEIKDKSALKTSGGEAQRTALARILALEPELLLLDEPTANVDPENTRIIEKAIMNMRKSLRGTIIIVTHNVFQALRLCDYVIYMEKGKIVEIIEKSKSFQSNKMRELVEFTSEIG